MQVPDSLTQCWIEEVHKGVLGQRFRVKKSLFTGKSDFQQVDIVDTYGHGRMMFIDGLVMLSERDEHVYHEMIAHVPLFCHPNPKRVLVIGGGDGGTIREVVRHPSVEQAVLVEIDALVVEVSKEFLPSTASALDDPRVTVRIEDGVAFVKNTDQRFDVIIVDSTDPIGPAAPLFGTEFYEDVRRVLNENGIVVSQGESPYYEPDWQVALAEILAGVFPSVNFYNYHNVTYPGGLWSFSFASKNAHPLNDFQQERWDQLQLETKYYDPGIHHAAFALPRRQKGLLAPFMRPLT
ncbi:MAG: polyamine aminopropyltransferase [Acidobacteria bacterium]|nr:polyamine aminopropyltransferase [Acidobacteriota bacterium]